MSARIYVAGCLERVAEARALAATLAAAGCEVVSTWHALDVSRELEHALDADARSQVARANHRDLARATALVLLADPRARGSLVEAGAALGRGAWVLAVGDARAHTLMLAGIDWYASVDAAVAALTTVPVDDVVGLALERSRGAR